MKMPIKILWRIFLLTLLIFSCNQSVRADSVAPPRPYKKISKNGEFAFVMLVPSTQICGFLNGYIQNCGGYTQSGLYRNNGDETPFWTIGWYAYDIEISSDGQHLIRKGPWAGSYDDEAISFFKNGKILKSYTINDLVHFPWLMPHSVSHFMWRSYEGFKDSSQTYIIHTLHGEHYIFDVKTGKVIFSCWIYLWILILFLPVLFSIRLLVSKNVYLFCIACIGITVLLFVSFFSALVVFIGLWATGRFISTLSDPSFQWSIKYLTKVNSIPKTSKTILFFCVIVAAAGILGAIHYKFFQSSSIDSIPSESLNCAKTKIDNPHSYISFFIDALRSRRTTVVNCAIMNLEKISSQQVFEEFAVALKDKDSIFRNHVAMAMMYFDDERIIAPLSEAIYDVDKNVRLQAVDALSKFKTVFEPLSIALNDKDKKIRVAAVEAMARQDDDRKVAALIPMLKDSEDEVRKAAAIILRKSGDRRVIELLREAIEP